MTIPSDMRNANVPTILRTGLLLHQGGLEGRVSPGVTVKAVGSEGSSGSRMLFDNFFINLVSCWGFAMCVWCRMMFCK